MTSLTTSLQSSVASISVSSLLSRRTLSDTADLTSCTVESAESDGAEAVGGLRATSAVDLLGAD